MKEESFFKQEPNLRKPDNIEKLKEELIIALEEEIKKIDEEGLGLTRYKVLNGQLIKQEEDQYIYRFITDDIIELPDDLPIEVKISNEVARGYIVTIVGFEVMIAIDKDLGQFIPSAILFSSAKFLLEKIKSILEDINSTNSKFNYDIVKKLFGLKRPLCTQNIKDFQLSAELRNIQQIEAILASLRNEILFIWGPPGTGKTTTLGRIVDCFLARNDDYKILVLSHTNVATDRAAEKIIDINRTEKYLIDGKIVRLGNILEDDRNRVLSEDKIKFVKVTAIAERKSFQFKKEREEQESKLEKLREKNKEIEALFSLRNQLFNNVDKLDELKIELENKKIKENAVKNKLKECQSRLNITELKIQKAEKLSKFIRFISGLNINNLILEKSNLKKDIENLQEQINVLEQETTTYQSNLYNSKRDYYRSHNILNFIHEDKEDINEYTLLNEFDQDGNLIVTCFNCDRKLRLENKGVTYRCPECEFKTEFFPVKSENHIDWDNLELAKKGLLSQIKEIQKNIDTLTEEINEIEDQIIKEAKVIITTITQSYSSKLISSMNFNAIIIDEASMIPLPVVFFASGLAMDKVIIIGDFKQLPPIAISENNYLNTDIFEFSEIKKNVEKNIHDDRLVPLKVQFRMHPEISDICNRYVYSPQNELVDSEEVIMRSEHPILDYEPYAGEPIVFCDTSIANPWCNSNPSGSAFNLYHSIFVIKLIEDALINGISEDKIGVITPYRDQAKFINKMRQQILPDKKIKISTIHKFQGLENEIIIFDTVISYGKKGGPGYFFSRSEQSEKTLNVAITRPKSKLIIVGNNTYLNNRLDTDSLMFKILDHFKKRNKVFESENILEKYYKEILFDKRKFEKEIDQRIETQYFSVVDQNDFYEIFEKDLLSVDKNEGVVIFSPFIQYARVSSLMNIFKAVIDKGAKISIFTEKRYQKQELFPDSLREVLDYLKTTGADIRYRARLHEKRAFISNRIWWEGSLNILSHSGTTEDMLRITQKEIVELAINNFGLSTLVGVGKIKREEREKWRSVIKNVLKIEEKKCPKCRSMLIVKFSRFGPFLACDNCKATETIPLKNLRKRIEDASIRCDKCNKGYIKLKTSKKTGKFSYFFACDNYPECKFILPI